MNKEKEEKKNGIAALFSEYRSLSKEIKDLEKERDAILDILKSKIPKNETKAGITHKVTEGKSVSYAKALPEIKTLVPKTKQPEIDTILENHTKWYERHKIEEAK